MDNESVNQLYKSQSNRVISGVCVGIAEYYHTSPLVIRLLFILLALSNGIGAAVYFVLALLLPSKSEIIEESEIEFFENITSGTYVPEELAEVAPDPGFFDDLIIKENIMAFIIILFGLIILQIDVEPWALIPEPIRIPIIVVLIGFSFIVKSLHITK